MDRVMIHLYHPCYLHGLDVWVVDTDEDERIARGQGYISQAEVEKLTGLSFDIDETWNFPFETWKWLQERE